LDLIGSFMRLWRKSPLFRNIVLSVLGWALMYLVFLFEVRQLGWQSQHAKLSITPLGFPLGIFIQWLVFRDSVRAILGSMSLWKAIKRNGVRWLAAKVLSFTVNQLGYAVVLHMAGMPYWAAYPASASILSLVYFAINRWWVFQPPAPIEKTVIP
jgi:hypothetical protein